MNISLHLCISRADMTILVVEGVISPRETLMHTLLTDTRRLLQLNNLPACRSLTHSSNLLLVLQYYLYVNAPVLPVCILMHRVRTFAHNHVMVLFSLTVIYCVFIWYCFIGWRFTCIFISNVSTIHVAHVHTHFI